MLNRHSRKAHPSITRKTPLLLLSISVLILFSICLISASAYAIDIDNDCKRSNEQINTRNDNTEAVIAFEENHNSNQTNNSNCDNLTPEEPIIQEGESPSKIPAADLQDKIGVPEIYDDGIFRYYLVDNSYYEVAGIYKSCFDSIVIPSELFGVPVKGIQSNAFRQYKYLVSVVIPESIEYIGDYAFHNCPNLKSISLPKSEIQIGEGVFQLSQ
ncbi:MAG: leucine-rich repeat protein [Eubacteriales bacterium]